MPVTMARFDSFVVRISTPSIAESTQAAFNEVIAAPQISESATIPSKYFANPTPFARRESEDMARRSLRTRTRKTNVITTSASDANSGGILTASPTETAKSIQSVQSGLPELPNWAIHVLAGCMTFLVVVGLVLYFAQFPPTFSWLGRFKRRGYTKVKQDERDSEMLPLRGESSAVASVPSDEDDGLLTPLRGIRRRKARHLSIDTGAEYRGLGIAVPGGQRHSPTMRTRRSYDAEALCERHTSSVVAAWQNLTAPLPSAKSFLPDPRSRLHRPDPGTTDADIETGQHPPSSIITSSTPELFDTAFIYFHDNLHTVNEEPPGSAIWKGVNEGIYRVADRLSRTFHDQVTGPEEGLLLPVHNGEREPPVTPGVFVG